jgi:putative membrane fusion protein
MKRILLILFLVTLLGLFAVLYGLPILTGALARTSLVEYGTLRVTDDVTCYFIRNEQVVTANGAGAIQYYYEEGELVRKGSKVAEVIPDGGAYFTDDNYIISYYIDGQEDLFTPETIQTLRKDRIQELEIEMANTKRETAEMGEALFKTVENGRWYVAFWVEQDDTVKYTKGTSVTLQLPNGDVKCRTLDIIDDKGQWLILLESDRYYADLPKLRKENVTVVTSDYEGLLLANGSIATQDGQPGVFVKDIGGSFVFRPVSVIASDGRFSLVEHTFYYQTVDGERKKIATVEAYDEILNDPERK